MNPKHFISWGDHYARIRWSCSAFHEIKFDIFNFMGIIHALRVHCVLVPDEIK
jgi:hypothetical protein